MSAGWLVSERVKLLLDENLSGRLVPRLSRTYPGTQHVEAVGLGGKSDREIWDYAATHGFAIASKDNDFRQLSFLYGAPPKVLWLAIGNAGTDAIADLLERRAERVAAFAANPEAALLVLTLTGESS